MRTKCIVFGLCAAVAALSATMIGTGCTGCTGSKDAAGELAFDSLTVDTVAPLQPGTTAPKLTLHMNIQRPSAGQVAQMDGINAMIVSLVPVVGAEGESRGTDVTETDFDQYANALVESQINHYRSDNAEAVQSYSDLSEIQWLNYESYYDGKVLNQVGDYLSYCMTAYFYTGGAHGSTVCNYGVYDLARNVQLHLYDITDDETRPYITALLANKVLPDYMDKSLNQLKQDGYLFDDAEIALNDNFYLSEEGITWVYQQYELAPYAMGLIPVTLTWFDLQPVLPDDSVLLALAEQQTAAGE